MTFRISRSGSFGGFGSLDPFGSSRGGLGRYNLGSDIASLEAYEAYAIAVGWQNGTVSDDEYLASLKRQWDLAPPNTREWAAAKDKYEDAVYTIARNKIVNDVNLAGSSSERIAALRRLIAHDQSRVGGMVEDNEQRRELQARIRSTEADIRQSEYGDLVERYNRGKATTQQLIDFVNRAIVDSRGAADNDDWQRTLGELVDRKNDEVVAAKVQDYQHDRDDGTSLRATLAAQLETLTPGSPKYLEVSRQLEDLDKQIRETRLAKQHDKTYNDWKNGKISDDAYLRDLARAAEEAPVGSREQQAAKQRLLEARFSTAEDKLQYQVAKGTKSPNDLIKFYRTYLATMNPDSYRARQLTLAIDRLKGYSSGGGGGGGGGRGGSGDGPAGLSGIEKYLGVPEPWTTTIAATKDVNGKPIPKGALDDLLRLDAANVTDRNWYNNNRRLLDQSYDLGAATWLFVDKKGNRYVLPFNGELYRTFIEAGELGFRAWMDTAKTPKEAQTATGMWITSQQRLLRLNQDITMEDYRDNFRVLERAKQSALASGDIGLYLSYTEQQRLLVRGALGILDEDTPTDVAHATRPLSSSDLSSIASDIDAISPYQPNPPTAAGQDPMNVKGDKLIWAATPEVGIIKYNTVRTPDGQNLITDLTIDENRGFFTQKPDGRMELVTHVDSPDLFAPVTLADETVVPAYRQNLTPVVTYQQPEDRWTNAADEANRVNLGPGTPVAAGVNVWVAPSQTLQAPMYVKVQNLGGKPVVVNAAAQGTQTTTKTTQVVGPAGATNINTATTRPVGFQFAPTGSGPRIWSQRIKSWGPGGYEWSTWVTTERPGTKGAIWIRLPDGSGVVPRVVLDPSPKALAAAGIAQFEYGPGGDIVVRYADGTTKAPGDGFDWSPFTRFYNQGDGKGPASIGTGAPGVDLEWTIADYQGRLHASRVSERRPERETIEVVGPDGKTTQRRRTADLETDEQVAARLARARGTGTTLHRDIDRQAYYDPEKGRWVSDLAKRPDPNRVEAGTLGRDAPWAPMNRNEQKAYVAAQGQITPPQSNVPIYTDQRSLRPSRTAGGASWSLYPMVRPPVGMAVKKPPVPVVTVPKTVKSVKPKEVPLLKPIQKKAYEPGEKPVAQKPKPAPKPAPKPQNTTTTSKELEKLRETTGGGR